MSGLTIVHAADLHVDSPMRGLARYEGAPVEVMRSATRQAVRELVDLCLEEEAALLLLAGDIFDGDWRDYSTGVFFAHQMSRLRQGDVRVVMIRGNHDAASVIQKHLPLPDNVHELPSRKPGTVRFDDLGVAVHGQSYGKRAVTRDLSIAYPEPTDGWLDIGLLHTCLDGRPGHEPYAPCKLEALVEKGYAYWALGHVHQREVLHEDPYVVFPGNLQGRNVRETGDKGATVMRVDDGRIAGIEHRAVDVARWVHLEVDIGDAKSGDDVLGKIRTAATLARDEAEGRPLATRVTLRGRSPAHGAWADAAEDWGYRLRAELNDLGEVWLEKVKLRSAPPLDREALRSVDDALGQVARACSRMGDDDDAVAAMLATLDPVARKLPRELRSRDGMRLDDPEAVRSLLPEVESLLIERLLGRGGDE